MLDTPVRKTATMITLSEALDAPLFDEAVDIGLVGKVILFNDEWHTFEEVIEQIIKATGCALSIAEAITWEVHTRGKAKVFEGDFDKCVRVSAILEEISLRTQIEV